MRDGSGCVRTADPVGQNDAVTKSYADNRFRYTHFIEAQFIPYDNVIVCKGIIIYVSNSATPLTSIDQLPLNVALPMHGLYMNNQIYTVTSTGNGSVDINTLSYSDASGISYGEPATMPLAIVSDTVL